MKIKLYSLFILISIFFNLHQLKACDPVYYGFNKSICHFNDPIFFGEIVATGEQYVDLKIIQKFRTCEQKEIVRIWDGTTVECNGPFAAPTSQFGAIGDSVICIAQYIDTLSNPWDKLDNYRRPIQFNYQGFLSIKNKVVNYFDEENNYVEDNFENYLEIISNDLCLNIIIDCISTGLNIYPNPVTNHLYIQNVGDSWNTFQIYDILGKLLFTRIKEENLILVPTNYLPTGVYFISFFNEEKLVETFKFMKH